MSAIFKREFRSYFQNMTGPIFIAVLLAFIGIFFVSYNMLQGYPYFSASLSSGTIILLLAVPILTMRSFAEEKKTKTDQLLLTSPVSVTEIVMGKFLSMAAVLAVCCAVMCAAPLVIHFYGGSGLLVNYISILEFFLLGCAYIAIGMFVSSLTESQVIAAVGTFAILLILQLADGMSSLFPTSAFGSYVCIFVVILLLMALLYYMTKNMFLVDVTGIAALVVLTVVFLLKRSLFEGLFATVFTSLSLVSRFDTITSQMFDLSAVVYFLTVAALFVFLTVQTIQKRRWS